MSRFWRRATASTTDDSAVLNGKSIDDDEVSSAERGLSPLSEDIITYPSASCTLPKSVSYTESQQTTMKNVREHLLQLHADLAEKDADYVKWERRWIDDSSTVRRYCVAVNWDEANAKKRATDTMNWRREYKPDLIVPDSVKREGETGKHIISGFDKCGRPVLYLRPGRENTEANPQQIRFLVFDLERAIDFCPANQDKITWVIDYHNATNASQPNFSTQLKVLSILQNHYPERLGLAIVVNVPFILKTFFTAISPFLDPVTRTKLQMLRSPDRVKEWIPEEMLDHDFGGTWRYQFDFERYWNQVLDFCGVASDGTRTHESKARQKLADRIDGVEAEPQV